MAGNLPVSSESSNMKQKRKNPNCAKCHNHGEKEVIDKHKCPFNECVCKRCTITLFRRYFSKLETSINRKSESSKKKNYSDFDQKRTVSGPKDAQNISWCPDIFIRGVSAQDIAHLQFSLDKIIKHFSSVTNPTFLHALYLTILKDNNLNCEAVIQKIEDGEKEYSQLGWKLQAIKSATPSPSNIHWPNVAAANYAATAAASSNPSASSPLINPFHHWPHHPHQFLSSAYSPLSYTHSSSIPSLTGSLPAHLSHHIAESASNALSPYVAYYPSHLGAFTTPPSSAASLGSDLRVFSPPNRQLTDGHTSGDSRGSAEYKDESDKEGGGNGRLVRDPPRTEPERPAPKRLKTFQPYTVAPVNWQERVETAANA